MLFPDSTSPMSSLRLLVPPLRLMTAFMWQVAQERSLEHYEKLENFVSLVTKMVPDLLSQKQKATLIMGLRAKVRRRPIDENVFDVSACCQCIHFSMSLVQMLLEMCRGGVPVDSQTLKTHLHQIQGSHLPKVSVLISLLISLLLMQNV